MLLYHNALSTCSQKVRMALHEKNLAFDSHLIDLQRGEQHAESYKVLNPNAVVPTLHDNDQILIESTLINEYLDDAYPEVPLRPESPIARHRMRLFCKQIDDSLHPACGVLTYAIGARPGLLNRPKAEVDALIAKIPNKTRRENRKAAIELGVHAPIVRESLLVHRDLFDQANQWLEENTWLSGPGFSLADCALMPYVLRAEHLQLRHELQSRPHLLRWYEAIQKRPAFEDAVSKWLPQIVVDVFKQAGQAVSEEIAEIV